MDPFDMKRGLNRIEAAEYIGIGTTKFDELVSTRRMPQPRLADSRTIWDLKELDIYFEKLPQKGEKPTGVWS